MNWTTERREILKRLFGEGHNSRQIAALMGPEVSRNAVIAKLNRLGLSLRNQGLQNWQNRSKTSPALKSTQEPSASAHDAGASSGVWPLLDTVALPKSSRVTILDLTNETCRWPIDDPHEWGSFSFCGAREADLEAHRPYCRRHAERVRHKKKPQEHSAISDARKAAG